MDEDSQNNEKQTTDETEEQTIADDAQENSEPHANTPISEVSKPKKKLDKKVLWIVLIVVLVLGGVGYTLFANDSEKVNSDPKSNDINTDSANDQTIETTKRLYFSEGGDVFYIDSSGETTSTDDTVYYDEEDLVITDFADNGNKRVSLEYLEEYQKEGEFLSGYQLVLSYLDGSKPDEVLAPSDLFVPIDWLDDNRVLLQKLSCFACEGGSTGVFASIDVRNGALEQLSDLAKLTNGGALGSNVHARLTPNKNSIVILNGPLIAEFQTLELMREFERAVYIYDIEDNKLTTLNEFGPNDSYYSVILGFNEDASSVIVSYNSFSQLEEKDDFGNEVGASFAGLRIINLSSGEVTSKTLELSEFKDGSGWIADATTMDQVLYLVTTRLSGVDESIDDSYSYKLRSLDLSQDTFEVATLRTSNDPIELLRVEVASE